MIRWRETWREAWRDTATGTSRPVLAVLGFAAAVGALACAQALGVVGVARDAQAFVEAGAAVKVVEFTERIDAAQCEAMASLDGIAAAGALRAGHQVRFAATPSRAMDTFEATPGLASLLGLDTHDGGPGLWLSADAADSLGVRPGDPLAVLGGGVDARVAGVFPFPTDDGRDPALSYSVLEPVPASGVFDACWMLAWPERSEIATLLTLPAHIPPVRTDGRGEMPVIGQLNTTLGTMFDAQGRLGRLPFYPLAGAAGLVGLALGAGLIRLRRLELASGLHAGVPKSALAVQMVVEAGLWVAPAVIVLTPLVWWVSADGNPDSPWPAVFPAAQTVAAATAGVLLGTLAATLATREKHLFRMFKNR